LLLVAAALMAVVVISFSFHSSQLLRKSIPQQAHLVKEELRIVQDKVLQGETLLSIFTKHGLDIEDIQTIQKAAATIFPLRNIRVGQPYTAKVEGQNRLDSFVYQINRDSLLKIQKTATSYEVLKENIPYVKRLISLSGTIEDNLISAIGPDREHLLLALQLSDMFAWNIDFAADLRKNDSYRIITEGLYLDGEFKGYGNIVAAEFVNDGELFKAYRFEHNGKADYYDEEGKSLQRAFLRAPLNFRRISSHFSGARLHPILRVRRPHNGIDYVAAAGTPVSSVGDGRVMYAGWKGAYGKMVIIQHPNGWQTYYGHLSRISPQVKNGGSVAQGQVIGNVGSTGLATGPHLHYEFRINNKPVNPLSIKIPEGWPIPAKELAAFGTFREQMDSFISDPRNLNKFAYTPDKAGANTKPVL
jgi:murein DD-endopeptidase MepM/ murein hydrolase activator NlpD